MEHNQNTIAAINHQRTICIWSNFYDHSSLISRWKNWPLSRGYFGCWGNALEVVAVIACVQTSPISFVARGKGTSSTENPASLWGSTTGTAFLGLLLSVLNPESFPAAWGRLSRSKYARRRSTLEGLCILSPRNHRGRAILPCRFHVVPFPRATKEKGDVCTQAIAVIEWFEKETIKWLL